MGNKMTAKTRIKICGITREEDLLEAVRLGVDALGFVAYPSSPRYVNPEVVARLGQRLPVSVTPVVLFVHPGVDEVRAYLDALPSCVVQFHGDESPQECERYAHPYWKAVRMKTGVDVTAHAAAFASAQALLLDAYTQSYGGAGQTFDWNLIPPHLPLPLVLSGGLNAHNVTEAVRRVRPWAVDVSSGVERAPGIKDAGKMRDFIHQVRVADADRSCVD
jgi:phosphoribosylanthranilate isomerase